MTNKVKYNKRSTQDVVWAQVKSIVDKRDKGCQVLKCLTIKEGLDIKKQTGFQKQLDRAHLLSAGNHPEFTYFPLNIRKISRTFHDRLDGYRDLVTNDPIDSNKRMWWAWRICNKSTTAYDSEVDYEMKLIELMKTDVFMRNSTN